MPKQHSHEQKIKKKIKKIVLFLITICNKLSFHPGKVYHQLCDCSSRRKKNQQER